MNMKPVESMIEGKENIEILTDFEDRDELCQRNYQEEEVVKEFELIEENHGNKCACVVFSIILFVSWEAAGRTTALEC